jgi:hypothetical protein
VGIYAENEAHKKPGELTSAKSHETVNLRERMEEACVNICRKEAHK